MHALDEHASRCQSPSMTVVNFVPNHGPFALHSLYCRPRPCDDGLILQLLGTRRCVPSEYDPPDATSFYKIASSAVVLDRQRAIR